MDRERRGEVNATTGSERETGAAPEVVCWEALDPEDPVLGRARQLYEETQAAPERFAVPPYVGHRGWIAIFLDGDVDWDELADLVEESYRMTAPKRLAARLDAYS